MEQILQDNSRARMYTPHISLRKGISWGLIGGLAGTLVMDLVLVCVLAAAGLPALTCFTIIGDTVARLLSIRGITVVGGVLMGMTAHYLIGPVFGVVFGAAVAKVNDLRVVTTNKGILYAVLYVEILSQPLLAMTPILLKMKASETLQWFGISFMMHLIWGFVLGAIVSHGLRLATPANHKPLGLTLC